MAARFLLLATAVGATVELTPENIDAELFNTGKAAFVKFLAPW